MVKPKANIGDKVLLKGNTSKAMNFKTGIIRRIGKTRKGNRIYYVSRMKSKFTTPFLTSNIIRTKKVRAKKLW